MGLTHMRIKELLDENRAHACDGFGPLHVCVKKEHVAIVHGDVTHAEDVPVRIHYLNIPSLFCN